MPNSSHRMRVNLYLTRKRAALFEEAFKRLQDRGMLHNTAKLERSRTTIVDFALSSLLRELEEEKK